MALSKSLGLLEDIIAGVENDIAVVPHHTATVCRSMRICEVCAKEARDTFGPSGVNLSDSSVDHDHRLHTALLTSCTKKSSKQFIKEWLIAHAGWTYPLAANLSARLVEVAYGMAGQGTGESQRIRIRTVRISSR